MKLAKKLAAVGITAALASPAAMADVILNWDWALFAGWTDSTVEGGGSADASGPVDIIPTAPGTLTGDSVLSWGVSSGSGQSSLTIVNPTISTSNFAGETGLGDGLGSQLVLLPNGDGTYTSAPVAGTMFSHANNPITGNSLTNAVLSEWFALSPDNGDPLLPATFIDTPVFDILFEETTNTGNVDDCVIDSTIPCNDVFVIANPDLLTTSFTLDGFIYTITIGAIGLTPLDGETCGLVGQPAGCLGFVTEEGSTNNALNVLFGLSARPVSAPSVLALMGLGLLGIGYSRRRNRA